MKLLVILFLLKLYASINIFRFCFPFLFIGSTAKAFETLKKSIIGSVYISKSCHNLELEHGAEKEQRKSWKNAHFYAGLILSLGIGKQKQIYLNYL